MTDLTSLTLAEARAGLANKSFTSLELTDAHLKAIEEARALNAFVKETPDQARAMAREADAQIGKGAGGPPAPTPRWCPAARPAARRRRWRRCCAWARPRPTPAARSASRRHSPQPSA